MSKYASLHTHSHGSVLDGYSTIPELVAEAQRVGQKHLAVTDHGNLFMAYELYKNATAAGIHPVIGIEAYVAPSHVTREHHEPAYFAGGGKDDVSSRGSYTHMLLFAKNNQGLQDLYTMLFHSYKEGNWRKNRIDMGLLRQYSTHLIGTTGCPSGELQTKLRLGMTEEAEEYVQMMQNIFGKDDYYMELMDHNMSISLERNVEPELLRIAKKYDIPLLATADSHYTKKEEANTHEHLLCISTHSKMSVPTSVEEGEEEDKRTRFAFDGTGYHLNTEEEMMQKFPEDKYPNAVTNTVKLAEKCNVTIEPNPELRPKLPLPEGHTEATYLTEQAWEGFHHRFKNSPRETNPEYIERLEEELETIIDMNYPGYFLVVSDFIRWAKKEGIRVGPGRGCLTEETRVLTSKGFKSIKNIQTGDHVYNQHGKLETVTNTFVYDIKEELIQIKAHYGGNGNIMTTDHKVLVSKTNNNNNKPLPPEWIPAKEIKIGDMVVLPKTEQPVDFNIHTIPDTEGINYDGKYAYFKVSETNKIPSKQVKVYDFTMPETHSYVTDSYIVHNSAAGSLLAYVLDITDAEPIRHGLLFSRFMSKSRPSMPDIDMDFDDRRRGEVINYVRRKYGEEQVAQVATYGMIKAKNAVKDVMRIYDEPYSTGDQLSKAMPEAIFGETMPLKNMYTPGAPRYEEAEPFRQLVKDLQVQDKVDIARKLEGRIRSTGVHACAVIISGQPIMHHIPTMVRKDDGSYITQWEYPICEELGLLKMDFLGLRNLGIIEDALKLIKKRHGVDLNMQEIVEGPMDDPATYRLLQSGKTLGVFQLDSGPIQDLLRLMQADRFEDISAVLALYRPGPMAAGSHTAYSLRKIGREIVQPLHPELEEVLAPILDETQQLITYQEQIMKIAQVVSGYTLGEADLLRRAMGKKKKSEMDAQWDKYYEGGIANGYSKEALTILWDTIVPFSSYAFNKCATGDTRVYLADSSQYTNDEGSITIEEIYNKLHSPLAPKRVTRKSDTEDDPYKGLCLNPDCAAKGVEAIPEGRGRCKACKSWLSKFKNAGVNLRAMKDGRIRTDRMLDVMKNGVKPVYEMILENGSSIKTTSNHRHFTSEGWKELKDIQVGSFVAHEGSYEQKEHEANGLGRGWGKGLKGAVQPDGSKRVMLHGQHSLLEKNKKLLDLSRCDECGVQNDGKKHSIEVAHLDSDRSNNELNNLRPLCNSCHKSFDLNESAAPRKHLYEKGYPIEYVKVVSVTYVGEEMTFDIEMQGEEHNYIANGVVTHNSHSVAYGLISYMTAFLKANYTVEYMSALLSSVTDDVAKTAEYLEDCRRLGVKVLPPDINVSEVDYVPVNKVGEVPVIRFGLKAIRGLGESTGQMIVDSRKKMPSGRFESVDDLFNNSDRELINKRVLEGLANGGGLDSLGYSRQSWAYHIPELVKQFQKVQRSKAKIQTSLFDLDDVVEYKMYPLAEYGRLEKLKIERNALGLYVSGHPVDGLNLSTQSSVEISGLFDGRVKPIEGFPDRKALPVRIAGVVTSLVVKRNKQGKAFAIMKLEDRTGTVECLMFWKQYEQHGSLLKVDEIYQFSGFLRARDESVSFTVDNVKPLDFGASGNLAVRFKVTEKQWEAGESLLKQRLANHPAPVGEPGDDVVVSIRGLDDDGEIYVKELRLETKVARSPALLQEIQELFGNRCIGRWLGVKKKVEEVESSAKPDTVKGSPEGQEDLLSGL